MAIGLASMNPMPGPGLGVVMMKDEPADKDLAQSYSNYNVLHSFDDEEATEVTIPVAFTVDEVWADIYTKHTNAGSETVTLHEMLELGDYTTVYWFDPPNGILSTALLSILM